MVSNIIQDLRDSVDTTYSQLVEENGTDKVIRHCLDSMHNLYYRRCQEQKGNIEDQMAKLRRHQCKRIKQNHRDRELALPSNADLANHYGQMQWNVVGATSEDETDEETSEEAATAEGSTALKTGTLVLPLWRSLQLEEVIRETDRRRRVRLRGVPYRAMRHPEQALLPPPGESPPVVPSDVYRWMVSHIYAHQYPNAVRGVRSNLLTARRTRVGTPKGEEGRG